MRKPSTSRHVYKKLDELEQLVTHFIEITIDDDRLYEFAHYYEINTHDIDMKQIEYVVSQMNYITIQACKIQSIVDYLSKFKLNSKLEFKFNYFKELYKKCLRHANSILKPYDEELH